MGAPSGDDIKSILSSVGVDADEERLSKVLSELSGKNVEDVIAEGKEKLASVPSGGAVAAGGAAAAGDLPPPRKKRNHLSLTQEMTIWDSVFSTKNPIKNI